MIRSTKFAPGYSTATDSVTGTVYTDEYDIFTIGAGYLNVPAALGNTDVFTGSALSPTAVFNSTTNTVNLESTALAGDWGVGTISLRTWRSGAPRLYGAAPSS